MNLECSRLAPPQSVKEASNLYIEAFDLASASCGSPEVLSTGGRKSHNYMPLVGIFFCLEMLGNTAKFAKQQLLNRSAMIIERNATRERPVNRAVSVISRAKSPILNRWRFGLQLKSTRGRLPASNRLTLQILPPFVG